MNPAAIVAAARALLARVPLAAWLALAAIVMVAVTVRSCTTAQQSAADTRALQRNDAAKDRAAIERRADDAAISNQQQERQDAIDNAPAGETGPATRALNCQRWMQQHPGADRPSGC